jgi:hypothetical protein
MKYKYHLTSIKADPASGIKAGSFSAAPKIFKCIFLNSVTKPHNFTSLRLLNFWKLANDWYVKLILTIFSN